MRVKPAFRPDAKFQLLQLAKKDHVNPVGESSTGYSTRVLSKPGEMHEIAQKSIVPPIVKQGTAFTGKGSNAGATSDNSPLPASVPSLSAILVRPPEGNHQESIISSMKADILQSELTTLIQTVFSLCSSSTAVSESEAADQRSHIFHLFRIMSEISEHASTPARTSSATQSKSKEMICRSMNAAVLRCAGFRAAEFDISTFESQLVALSVALEWLELTSSGQVQNGTAAVPITCQSAHPYSDAVLENTHDVRIPGAIALKIHFNKKSETHSEGHCLTFTSGSLSKPQVYSKRTWAGVGTAPKLVIDGDSFTAVFDSNGGGSKWGYSFTVTPVFPDLSSLLLLPLRATIAALCFGSSHALQKSEPRRAAVGPPEAPCPVVSLIDEVRSQSAVGQRFQHLIRGPNPVFRVFKDSQSSLGPLLAQAHATHHVHLALPHVSTFEFEYLNVFPV